ncbi:MAG: ATPase [delta proteobacterium ML8_F1]|jgi:V/A-type H+/Na+-transporting ATPase subunit D|nr:MAG: ATPase [delta proteobacterium ML8_F1]
MNESLPTKANLMRSRSRLDFSVKGFELLDKKRNVLIREMMGLADRAQTLGEEVDKHFRAVNEALIKANITLGSNTVEEMAMSIPRDEDFRILTRSVMGVELPFVDYQKKALEVSYGFFRTNSALDTVVVLMHELKPLLYELAEVENAVFRLAMEVKKTQKRANALDKIQIPKYREITKHIEEALEEKEREDFYRLKKVKQAKKK